MLAQLVLSSEQFSHSRSWQRLWTRWYMNFHIFFLLPSFSMCRKDRVFSFVLFRSSSICSLTHLLLHHIIYCSLILLCVLGGSNSSTNALYEDSNPSYWCISQSGKFKRSLYIQFDPSSGCVCSKSFFMGTMCQIFINISLSQVFTCLRG